MTTPRRSPRIWLLSVASVGALQPGCAKEHDDDACNVPSDSDEDCVIAIGVVIPRDSGVDGSAPYPNAATGLIALPDATVQGPGPGWDRPMGVNVVPDPGPHVGSVVAPGTAVAPDAGPLDATETQVDAQAADAASSDANVDASCPPFLGGIVVHPSDAACPGYPFPGILMRP